MPLQRCIYGRVDQKRDTDESKLRDFRLITAGMALASYLLPIPKD
jgi:hypothetical protein